MCRAGKTVSQAICGGVPHVCGINAIASQRFVYLASQKPQIVRNGHVRLPFPDGTDNLETL